MLGGDSGIAETARRFIAPSQPRIVREVIVESGTLSVEALGESFAPKF